jgi:ABC-type transporter Mla subunit MlaD
MAEIEPSLPNLSRSAEMAPEVLRSYADAAPDLIEIIDNATELSQSIIDEQQNLDMFLVSTIGLADLGNEVLTDNRRAITDVSQLLIPTTDLAERYHEALTCGLAGLIPLATVPPSLVPGVVISTSFTAGVERYRYPGDLPRIGATGGPHCADMGLPDLPVLFQPPFLVSDVGSNPWKYGNQGLLLNAEGLKQHLFGPLDGPPRNSAQIGQPG